jgi:hypothetical protein
MAAALAAPCRADTGASSIRARREDANWLGEVEAWCRTVAAKLGSLTCERRCLALDAVGITVKGWRANRRPATGSKPASRQRRRRWTRDQYFQKVCVCSKAEPWLEKAVHSERRTVT